jgi:hypothetical protein
MLAAASPGLLLFEYLGCLLAVSMRWGDESRGPHHRKRLQFDQSSRISVV